MSTINFKQPATISEELDALLVQQCDALAYQAEIAARCVLINDPAGLSHALRQMAGRLRSLINITSDLRERSKLNEVNR